MARRNSKKSDGALIFDMFLFIFEIGYLIYMLVSGKADEIL